MWFFMRNRNQHQLRYTENKSDWILFLTGYRRLAPERSELAKQSVPLHKKTNDFLKLLSKLQE